MFYLKLSHINHRFFFCSRPEVTLNLPTTPREKEKENVKIKRAGKANDNICVKISIEI